MIAASFYTQHQVTNSLLTGKVRHYRVRPPTTVVRKYTYQLKRGDTIYSLAEKVFGKDQQHLWYIIADCNSLREIDSWEKDDYIFLPELIVKETQADVRRKSESSSRAIVFPKANTTSTGSNTSGGENITTPESGGTQTVGSATFLSLLDTPDQYEPLKLIRINAEADGIEFIDESQIDHNKLFNFDPARHRKMVYTPVLGSYIITD